MRAHRAILLLILLLSGGCLWRSYSAIMGIHLDVLTQIADKLCATAASGKGIKAEAMAEYFYPAKRARQFLRQFNRHEARQSYQKFEALLGSYEEMVRRADALRAQGGDWQAATTSLQQQCDDLHRLAAGVRAELQAEG